MDLLLSERNARVVMYGDDTWLKLFPGRFLRYDGTTSFIVSDYTEVKLMLKCCCIFHLSILAG